MAPVEQIVLDVSKGYQELDRYWQQAGVRRLFLVCGASIRLMPLGEYFDTLFERLGIEVVRFSDFRPNPDSESVEAGIQAFQDSGCGMIAAVGGGSAIDVAKCIKLHCCSGMKGGAEQPAVPGLVAIPTTAGSGSEATRFAVIYHQGRKQSITDRRCIPSVVVFDPSALSTLPPYHKKAAMLDALCHGIESCWSVNSTDTSRAYSKRAIELIMIHMEGCLKGNAHNAAGMLRAAHLAGKAINITQTTAGHGMSYGLTSRYGVAHGHAAALCVSVLWPYMLEHMEDCVDPRGSACLGHAMQEIAAAMGCKSPGQAVERFRLLLEKLELGPPPSNEIDLDQLMDSVAPERLRNHPIRLERPLIKELYGVILRR